MEVFDRGLPGGNEIPEGTFENDDVRIFKEPIARTKFAPRKNSVDLVFDAALLMTTSRSSMETAIPQVAPSTMQTSTTEWKLKSWAVRHRITR